MSWTLDELVRRAGDALAAQAVRVPNGRVTPLPDRRVVRWYSTIGLVDRPLSYRGRTALYGPRHLLQVVAVKRRQSEGRSLAEIQAELTGATDSALREIAQLPATALAAPDTASAADGIEAPAARPRFWADAPAATRAAPAATPDAPSATPAAPLATPAAPVATRAAPAASPAAATPGPAVLYAVELRPGATLTLPTQPGPDDLTEIRAAARPLLDLLARRGLLPAGSAD
jgi:hypothetical protein